MKERQYWNCTVPATILCQFCRSTDMENYEENSGFRNAWSKVISYAKKYICTICVYVFFRESTGELENFCFYCLLWFLIKVLYEKKITNTIQNIVRPMQKENKSCQLRGETFTMLSTLNRHLLHDARDNLVKEAERYPSPLVSQSSHGLVSSQPVLTLKPELNE